MTSLPASGEIDDGYAEKVTLSDRQISSRRPSYIRSTPKQAASTDLWDQYLGMQHCSNSLSGYYSSSSGWHARVGTLASEHSCYRRPLIRYKELTNLVPIKSWKRRKLSAERGAVFLLQILRFLVFGFFASVGLRSMIYSMLSMQRYMPAVLTSTGCTAISAVAQDSLDSIPYELVRPANKPGSYELRLYQPRFIVEMPYKSRATAYMEFDKYLTGGLI